MHLINHRILMADRKVVIDAGVSFTKHPVKGVI